MPEDDAPRPEHHAEERARLAGEALARAKADALARGEALPLGAIHADRLAGGDPRAGRPARARAPRRARRDDPQPLQAAIDALIDDQGWRTASAVASVFGRWHEIVGADLAAHTRPDGLTEGELVVLADSTAWATQVRLLAATLIRRLNAELGDGTVKRVKVRGPEQPRRAGEWRVRGGRGPRDTYG